MQGLSTDAQGANAEHKTSVFSESGEFEMMTERSSPTSTFCASSKDDSERKHKGMARRKKKRKRNNIHTE